MKTNRAIFFDRDGVINRETGDYITRVEDFEILPRVIDFMKQIQLRGYKIFVVTNQGGIAKGLYTHQTLKEIMQVLFNAAHMAGITIHQVHYCPHHPVVTNCICRKPDSLMIEKIIAKYNIDPHHSYIIGDTERDILAGQKTGLNCIRVESNIDLFSIIDKISL